MSRAAQLRSLLEAGPLLVPGAYDALSAKIFEQAGFPAIYRGGYSMAASRFALPDIGLVGREEMVDHARTLVEAVSVPVIADADDGYGSPAGVARTVQRFEAVGLAAIQIEDQAAPKRCGHMEGKKLVSKEQMVEKVAAAMAARREMLIIARSDAIAVEGIDAAIDRANAYAAEGADIIFIDAPTTREELARIGKEVKAPLMCIMAENEKTPIMPTADLVELGYRLIVYPTSALFLVAGTVRKLAQTLKAEFSTEPFVADMFPFSDLNAMMGFHEWERIDHPTSVG